MEWLILRGRQVQSKPIRSPIRPFRVEFRPTPRSLPRPARHELFLLIWTVIARDIAPDRRFISDQVPRSGRAKTTIIECLWQAETRRLSYLAGCPARPSRASA